MTLFDNESFFSYNLIDSVILDEQNMFLSIYCRLLFEYNRELTERDILLQVLLRVVPQTTKLATLWSWLTLRPTGSTKENTNVINKVFTVMFNVLRNGYISNDVQIIIGLCYYLIKYTCIAFVLEFEMFSLIIAFSYSDFKLLRLLITLVFKTDVYVIKQHLCFLYCCCNITEWVMYLTDVFHCIQVNAVLP